MANLEKVIVFVKTLEEERRNMIPKSVVEDLTNKNNELLSMNLELETRLQEALDAQSHNNKVKLIHLSIPNGHLDEGDESVANGEDVYDRKLCERSRE